MAIDTQNRRASCLGVAQPHHSLVFPNPDGSLANVADRQHMAYAYPGIAAAAAVSFLPATTLTVVPRTRVLVAVDR